MAVAEKDDAAQFKADWLEAKKRASDLQGEVDSFAVERKKFQDLEAANEELKNDLKLAELDKKELEAQLADALGELKKVNGLLAKAEKQNAAAQKIKEGLAELV